MNKEFVEKIMLAREFISQGKYVNAIGMLNRAIEICPNDPYPYSRKGFIYLDEKDYARSIENYEIAIELGMETPEVFGNLALAEYYVGWYEDALRDSDIALDLDEQDASVYNTKGLVLSKLGDDKRAIDAFSNVINYGIKNAISYRNRGKSYLQIGSLNNAFNDLNKAIELNPRFYKSYNTRGLIYSSAKKYDEAVSDFIKAIELAPNDEQPYFNLADAYLRKGEYELAYNNLVAGEELCENDVQIQEYGLLFFTVLSHFSSPFLLHRIIKRIYVIDTFLSFQNLISQNFNQCLDLVLLLDYIDRNESLQMDHYHVYKGIINYYMKDPSISYKIFDEIVDVHDRESLMGQYYFMLSCTNYIFSEKEQIYRFAIEKAKKYVNTIQTKDNSDQLYYAGQILFISENFPEALKCFEECEDFIPALCMKIICLDQNYEIERRDELIKELLVLDRHNNGLLQYLEIPSIGLKEFEESIQLFSYIKEIEGVIPILNQYSESIRNNLEYDYGSIIHKIADVFTLNEDRIEGNLPINDTVIWRNELLEKVCMETEVYFMEVIKDHFLAWQRIDDTLELEQSIGREIPLILNITEVRDRILHLIDYFDIKGGLNSESRYLLWFWSEICIFKSKKLTESEKRVLKISINGLFKIAIGSFAIPYFLPAVVFFLGYQITKDHFTKMIADFIEHSYVKEGERIPEFYSEFKEQFESFLNGQLDNPKE